MTGGFEGFSEETVAFLLDLKENNDQGWFNENRDLYEKHFLEPSRAFVKAMGRRLPEISPNMIADPRVNRSLFRLNRDVRFSSDKTPYKTNLGILFWEGPGKRMERPSFYFQIEEDRMMLAGGMYMIPEGLLDRYREVVSKEGPAKELDGILKRLKKNGIQVGEEHYKRIPKGFTEDHPYSYLLKHNGVYGYVETGIPKEFFSEDLIDHCIERFKRMDPLNKWFLKFVC